MAKGNNTLLIFDFDNTITNGHMHGAFSGKYSRIKKSDYNSAAENAVTDHNIKDFLKNTGGIKNEEGLKSALQSALSGGMEVNIASYTGYPRAVKKVVEDYLGLSKEQADSVSVFSGLPEDYDDALKGNKEQRSKVGKNLHICKAIVEYKDKHGELPKTVMLVDDDVKNIEKINEFVASMSKREEWLEKNGLSIEEIQKIKFEGAQVPEEDKNVGYLDRVQEFVNANLVQEPIYENLKKEEPIYQNLQDIQRSSFQEKPPQLPPKLKNLNVKAKPPLPPEKRKSGDGVVVDDENKKQDIKDMSSSKVQANPTCSKRHAMMLDSQQIESVLQNTEGSLPDKRYAYTKPFSLFRKIHKRIEGCVQKIINASRINKNIIAESFAQIIEKKEKIKDLGNNCKGDQLERKLLNAGSQKENINSNYNDGEPTHQTVQEARNYHRQKKGIDSNPVSKKLLAPPVPPKNYTEKVTQSRNSNIIER